MLVRATRGRCCTARLVWVEASLHQATRGFAPCAAVLPIRPMLLVARILLTVRLGVATREDIGEVGAAGTGEVLAAPEMFKSFVKVGSDDDNGTSPIPLYAQGVNFET